MDRKQLRNSFLGVMMLQMKIMWSCCTLQPLDYICAFLIHPPRLLDLAIKESGKLGRARRHDLWTGCISDLQEEIIFGNLYWLSWLLLAAEPRCPGDTSGFTVPILDCIGHKLLRCFGVISLLTCFSLSWKKSQRLLLRRIFTLKAKSSDSVFPRFSKDGNRNYDRWCEGAHQSPSQPCPGFGGWEDAFSSGEGWPSQSSVFAWRHRQGLKDLFSLSSFRFVQP